MKKHGFCIQYPYIDKKFEEDLEFARRTEAAFKRYEKGGFKEADGKKFLEMLKEW